MRCYVCACGAGGGAPFNNPAPLGASTDALEGKGPQRLPQGQLDRRLEGVAKAVGGGYCQLQMPLKLALGVRETVAGHRLGALEGAVTAPPSHASLGGGGYGVDPPSHWSRFCSGASANQKFPLAPSASQFRPKRFSGASKTSAPLGGGGLDPPTRPPLDPPAPLKGALVGDPVPRACTGKAVIPCRGGYGSSVRPLRGRTVCMGPTWGPKTNNKSENGIFGISASRGGRGAPGPHRNTVRQAMDGLWTKARGQQTQLNDPHNNQHNPQYANHGASRTRKRHQQEHRPQRQTERSDPTQHAKGRTGDCPGPRKGATTRRNVTRGVQRSGHLPPFSMKKTCKLFFPNNGQNQGP